MASIADVNSTQDSFDDLQSYLRWAGANLRGLLFVGSDPHYAIGIDGVAPGLRIACAAGTPAIARLRAEGVASLALDEVERPFSREETRAEHARSALAVVRSDRARAFERATRPGGASPLFDGLTGVVAFKASHALADACRSNGWRLIAGAPAVARRWENKIAFRDLAARLGLQQPNGGIVDPKQVSFSEISGRFGPRLIVQAAHGYAGNRTLPVEDEAGWHAATERLRVPALRVAERVAGAPITLNGCVTANGVALGFPFVQLTGLAGLTPHPLGSCGQVWTESPRWRLALDPDRCWPAAMAIGSALAADGYLGFFGVDLVVPPNASERPYVIEVNPRLVASVAAYTQLELMAGRLPLLARHLAALASPRADRAPLDAGTGPLAGAQLVVHRTAAGAGGVSIDKPQDGVHRLVRSADGTRSSATGGAQPTRVSPADLIAAACDTPLTDAVKLADAYRPDEFVALPQGPGVVATGAEALRIQLAGPAALQMDAASWQT